MRAVKKKVKNKLKPKIKKKLVNHIFSIILPITDSNLKYISDSIESLLYQSYKNWELCICVVGNVDEASVNLIKKYSKKSKKVKVTFNKKGKGIGFACNQALKLAKGDYIGYLEPNDILLRQCFREFADAVNEYSTPDVLYCNEAMIIPKKENLVACTVKPHWSPDHLLTTNYMGNLTVISRKILEKVGGFSEDVDGAHLHDLFLKISEATSKIYPIKKVLYNYRIEEKHIDDPWAFENGEQAVRNALKRRGLKGRVKYDWINNCYRIKYHIVKKPLVSIIIPFRDKYSVLKTCLDSIDELTSYTNYEIILVDNQSSEKQTLNYLNVLGRDKKYTILKYDKKFNFSAINNFAVKHARGKYLLFLNNDIRVESEDWIQEMLGICQQDHVGAVGSKLVFPNGKIQHAGVYMQKEPKIGVEFLHVLLNEGPKINSNGERIRDCVFNYTAVTAACMMMRKSVFKTLNGFDEKLNIFFNDTDLCIKALEHSLSIAYTPYARLTHFEGVTRFGGSEDHVVNELQYMKRKWLSKFDFDPFYSPDLHKKFSILMPLIDCDKNQIEESIKSCLNQSYSNWELCIGIPKKTNKTIFKIIGDLKRLEPRIKTIEVNGEITLGKVLNWSLNLASGDFIGVLGANDVLVNDCLKRIIRRIRLYPDAQFLYTNESKITAKTDLIFETTKKPEWAPDNLLVSDYIGRFSVIESAIVRDCGGYDENIGDACEYDLYLKATERTHKVYLVAEILYYRRCKNVSEKIFLKNNPNLLKSRKTSVEYALKRRALKAKVVFDWKNLVFRNHYEVRNNPLVSIVIPFRDKYDVLKMCLDSIKKMTTFKRYEIILVNNQSTEPKILKYLKKLSKLKQYKIVDYDSHFNYAAINNEAVKYCKGDFLLFLNNDVEIVNRNWI